MTDVWDSLKIIDGWAMQHTAGSNILTAQFIAHDESALPVRGDMVPTDGINAVPRYDDASGLDFSAYVVAAVRQVKLTGAGPWLIEIEARSWLGSHGTAAGVSLLRTNTVTSGRADFAIEPAWCGVKSGAGDWDKGGGAGVETGAGKWVSALDDKQGKWTRWNDAVASGLRLPGSPFRHIIPPQEADQVKIFLEVTVVFYRKETRSGLAGLNDFTGVVPVGSFPAWLKLPGGNDRWRLWDERFDNEMDTNGRTQLYRVTRVLLGIPSSFKDVTGSRARWDDRELGQKNWGDL